MNQLTTYNLGSVLRRTGINADTLRAWERRYKLPTPQRSEGGHRLYSERDVEIVEWLMRQQKTGMRIGQAVKHWRQMVETGEDPLHETGIVRNSLDLAVDLSQIEGFRKKWVDACLRFDETEAEQVANDAFTRFSPEVAFTEVFLPSVREIGQLWYEGKVTVQQEHFASALLMRRLDALITTSPPPTRPEKMIIACPPKEEHTLSALLLTLFLRRRGFHVVYLGDNVPLAAFKETVENIKPDMILFVAQQLRTAATLEQTIQALSPCGVTVGYSGRIFNTLSELRNYMSGEFMGSTFDDVFSAIESFLREARVPRIVREENPYAELLEAFEIAHVGIHAQLNESLSQWSFPLEQMSESTVFLSEAIAASLYFGDLNLLQHELSWVQSLLDARASEVSGRVGMYLIAYAKATQEAMGDIAQPLIDWLAVQSAAYTKA